MSLIFSEAKIFALFAAQIGNKSRSEDWSFKRWINLNNQAEETDLLSYFLEAFAKPGLHHYAVTDRHHQISVVELAERFISDPGDQEDPLYEVQYFFNALYEASNHPAIKAGLAYLAIIKDIILDDEVVDAVGIFKPENNNQFLVSASEIKEGILLKSLEKGALIFNKMDKDGLLTLAYSRKDANYWMNDFLKLKAVKTDSYYTDIYMKLCEDFAKAEYDPLERVNFVEKAKESLGRDEITFYDLEKILGKDYKNNTVYRQRLGDEEFVDFKVVPSIVKKNAKKLDNKIKLDTGTIEVANLNTLERGHDEEKGMHYYKIYYNEEK